MIPLCSDLERCVRRILQRIVACIEPACLNIRDFLSDRDHRVAEPVEFGLALGLRRLDHQRVGHRKGQGRRMKAEVHQALGHVLCADAVA